MSSQLSSPVHLGLLGSSWLGSALHLWSSEGWLGSGPLLGWLGPNPQNLSLILEKASTGYSRCAHNLSPKLSTDTSSHLLHPISQSITWIQPRFQGWGKRDYLLMGMAAKFHCKGCRYKEGLKKMGQHLLSTYKLKIWWVWNKQQ